MPRKKRVKEAKFDVTHQDATTGDVETSTVDAANQQAAIQKASQGKPGRGADDQVTVAPSQTGGPPTKPNTAPMSATPTNATSQTQGMQNLTQSFDRDKLNYDYVIGLPQGFEPFMTKLKGRSKAVVIETRVGRVYTTIKTPKAMETVFNKLKKASRSKVVEERDKAGTVIRGIIGSMKK